MNTNEILQAIDQQIAQLQQARALLAEAPVIQATNPAVGKRRGRPKGSVNKKTEVTNPVPKKTRAPLSAEGKARIAAAQKARWAAIRKVSKPSQLAAKKVAVKSGKKAVASAKTATKKFTAKEIVAKGG